MKKTITAILTLVLVVATLMGTATTAFACDVRNTDTGYVTMDTVFHNDSRGLRVTVGDLFWTGSIGSAESSGTLNFRTDCVTWTLKDGVLILAAHPEKGEYNEARVSACITYNSPFWNNEHIETIVIDSDVYNTDNALFRFGLPNLKNVIFLGNTGFAVVHTSNMRGQITDAASFPIDHEINYVWEAFNDVNGYGRRHNYPYAVGTGVDADTFETDNAYFTDRTYYLAAAAPIVANATLTQEAIDMLPADMVAAVNSIGGFRSLSGNPSTTAPTVNVTSDINVTVNGTPVVWTDAAPFIDENDRTMVPLRAVADAMGLNVEWKADSRTAVFTRGDDTIMFVIGFKVAFNNRSDIDMDTEPVIRNGRTYAPIRYLAEFFGYTVDWDGATQTVIITS